MLANEQEFAKYFHKNPLFFQKYIGLPFNGYIEQIENK